MADFLFPVSAGESAIAPSPPTGTSGVGIPTGRAYAIASAASKYNVPINTLLGVFGMETDFGRNINTSSANAQGAFQFIPSTAAAYGYPLTNQPTPGQFQQQADSAAHYLADLFKKTRSWDASLHAYSGGGYGQAQVDAKAKQAPGEYKSILNATGFTSTAIGTGTAAVANAVTDVPGVLSGIFNTIVRDLRYSAGLIIVLVIAGGLILHGLRPTDSDQRRPIPVPLP